MPKDSYTSISAKGLSVVDYLCVPHNHLKYWKNFSVLPVSDIIHENDVDIIQSTTMPDHSVVLQLFHLYIYIYIFNFYIHLYILLSFYIYYFQYVY